MLSNQVQIIIFSQNTVIFYKNSRETGLRRLNPVLPGAPVYATQLKLCKLVMFSSKSTFLLLAHESVQHGNQRLRGLRQFKSLLLLQPRHYDIPILCKVVSAYKLHPSP